MASVRTDTATSAATGFVAAELGIRRILDAAVALFDGAVTASLVAVSGDEAGQALRDLVWRGLRPPQADDRAEAGSRLVAVPDIAADPRFSDQAAVVQVARGRSFGTGATRFVAAGFPALPDGGDLALCVMGPQPLAASASQVAGLTALTDSLGAILALRDALGRLERREPAATEVAEVDAPPAGRVDALTGLPNRLALTERLDRIAGGSAPAAVLMVDLDRLKDINDTLGRDAGDAVLCEAGYRIRQAAPDDALVARAGSDEFAVVLEGPIERFRVLELARGLVDALAAQFVVADEETHSGGCVGISFYPDDATSAWQLLRNADVALHEAKRQARGSARIYDPGMLSAMLHRKSLETELHRALAANEFDLHFQPIVPVDGEPGITVEALLRWNRPRQAPIGPASFLEIAESCGLILPLGRQIMRLAAKVLARWRAQGLAVSRVAINLASAQLVDPSLLEDLALALAEAGLQPSDMELEITEGVLFSDSFDVVERTLDRLTAAGFSIVLDDFGTGYASLVHLKQASVGALKIDRSFVQGLPEGGNDKEIVRAMVALGRSLGLRIVAEGVETEQQLDCLRQLGCRFVQGYFIARPAPEQEMSRFLASWQAGRPH